MINKTNKTQWLSLITPLFFGSCVLGLLIRHISYYMPFLSDDTLISLRYAKRLLEGQGLTWTDGPAVEGYTNLLWILISALLGWVGFDLIDAVRLMGITATVLCLTAIAYPYYSFKSLKQSIPILFAIVFVVMSAPIAAWSIGGLEQPLLAALLVWGIVFFYPLLDQDAIKKQKILLSGLFFALICLTRADGALFTILAVVGLFAVRGINRSSIRMAIIFISLPLLFYLLQLVFRLNYYGDWIPNTARIKAVISPSHAKGGIIYIVLGFHSLQPFSILGIFSIIILLLRKEYRKKTIFTALMIFGWLGYLILIGGDIFPAWRHFVPIIMLMALLFKDVAELFIKEVQGRGRSRFFILTALAVVGLFFLYERIQITNKYNIRAKNEKFEWDGQVIGQMFKKGFGDKKPLFAVTVAGCLPYFSELPAIDMLGLNDYHIARNPPSNLGQGIPGHEHGDGAYLLERKPDLILFCQPGGSSIGCWRTGKEAQKEAEFFENYRQLFFIGTDPYLYRSLVWVRIYSEKIGMRVENGKMIVPSYLFERYPAITAYLNTQNEFVVDVLKESPIKLNSVHLPKGKWRIEARSTVSHRLRIRKTETDVILYDQKLPATFEFGDSTLGDLDLLVENADYGQLTELVLSPIR